jgi:hypothetical protein
MIFPGALESASETVVHVGKLISLILGFPITEFSPNREPLNILHLFESIGDSKTNPESSGRI